jgi:exopolysaccharide biosynthesis polyprenyl glycosylphosphotransferase
MTQERSVERSVLLQDVVVLLASLVLAHGLRDLLQHAIPVFKPAVPVESYGPLILAFLPTWVWCAERLQLNRVRTITGPVVDLVRALVWTQAWGTLAIALLLTLTQTLLNRSLLSLFLFVSTLLLMVAKAAQRRWVIRERGEALALVIGDPTGDGAHEVAAYRGRAVERLPSADPDDLRARLRRGGVDEVVVAGMELEEAQRIVGVCDEVGLAALLRLDHGDVGHFPPRVEVVGPSVYLNFVRRDPDPTSLVIKGFVDRVVSVGFLLACLPLLGLVALLVKITSKGPVLFVQERGGLNGRAFRMLKFRTMRAGAEAERAALLAANEMDGPVFKIAEDPRITPLGRFLRRTSLDELPQLVNVMLGHMSLVGPRPLPLVETQNLTGPHRRRLSVKPGLTCLWQVKGRNTVPFREWMALDLEYVDNWSLGLDLVIVLRTLPALLSGRGAR